MTVKGSVRSHVLRAMALKGVLLRMGRVKTILGKVVEKRSRDEYVIDGRRYTLFSAPGVLLGEEHVPEKFGNASEHSHGTMTAAQRNALEEFLHDKRFQFQTRFATSPEVKALTRMGFVEFHGPDLAVRITPAGRAALGGTRSARHGDVRPPYNLDYEIGVDHDDRIFADAARKIPFNDARAIRYMEGWWSSEDDLSRSGRWLLSIGTHAPKQPVEVRWVRRAIHGLTRELAAVVSMGGGKFQLGRGTFSKKEIDELRYIRSSLLRALKAHGIAA